MHNAGRQETSTEGTDTFSPVKILDLELSQPLPSIPAVEASSGRRCHTVRMLLRLHSQPLGQVDLPFDGDRIEPANYAAVLWQMLGERIIAHLISDGLPGVDCLPLGGLTFSDALPCLAEQRAVLENPPTVTVVLCTRDRPESAEICLDAVLRLNYPCFDVLVVDNAPQTSATADLVRRRFGADRRVRYVREDRPGLSWARNRALAHTTGEIVAFIDDDEVPTPTWLAEIAAGFRMGDEVACVTGLIVAAEINTQAQDWFEQFGGHSKGRGLETLTFSRDNYRGQNPLFPVPPFGTGGNMAYRVSVLRGLGGFDTTLGAGTPTHGGEDTAAFFDLMTAGHTLVFRPAAIVRHYHRRDFESLRRQLYGYGVGLTAFLTRCLVKNPRCVLSLLNLAPTALRYFASPRSLRTRTMQPDYPKELHRLQLSGMLHGPLAYVQSWRRIRPLLDRYGPLSLEPDTLAKKGA